MADDATLAIEERDGGRALVLSGDYVLPALHDIGEQLNTVAEPVTAIDIRGIGRIDTIGAWLIQRAATRLAAPLAGDNDRVHALVDLVVSSDQPVQVHADRINPFLRVVTEMGEATSIAFRTMIGLVAFFGAVQIGVWQTIREPSRLRSNALVRQFETVGVQALGIIGLMSFLIGVVVAQQGAVQLRQFGAEVFTINLVGRITIRELGILMTAIMVAGRSGSAFAAQIGSMKLAEEVDAMRTIGVSPMDALILPRILATIVMMPLLGFYASALAILGGGLFCWIDLDIPPITFVQRLREVVPLTDVWVGLIKAPVFGWIIAMSGCFQGMQVEGNNEEVGLKTTAAVVQAIFLVIVLDAFFAVFFSNIGWD